MYACKADKRIGYKYLLFDVSAVTIELHQITTRGVFEMKKRIFALVITSALITILMTGCGKANENVSTQSGSNSRESEAVTENTAITLTSEITELEDGFSAVQFEGDDGF